LLDTLHGLAWSAVNSGKGGNTLGAPVLPPIGERLRQARMRRGMTVRGLARLVDVSASLISQIETGKSSPSVSTLYAITAALDISVEDVFGNEGTAARTAGTASEALPGGAARPERAPVATNGSTGTVTEPGVAPSPVVVASAPAFLAAATGFASSAPTAPASATGAPATATLPAGVVHGSADRSADSPANQGLRQLSQRRRVGPVVPAGEREVLHLDSGVTWELLGQLPDAHVDFIRITYSPGGSSSGAGVLMRHSGTEWGHMLSGQLTLTLGFDQYVLNPGDSVSFDCSTPHSYANHGSEPAVGVWFVAERYR
jgi:transcriptional regulator with XRE-family HTH domain/quercetin dioxygenase-like cupin family protein